MTRHRAIALCVTLILCSLATPASAGPLGAPSAQAGPNITWHEPSLAPLGSAGFVVINSLVLRAELVCEGERCRLKVSQAYGLHNRDKTRENSVRLTVADPAEQARRTTLLDPAGAPLTPKSDSQASGPIWEVRLGRDEVKTYTLVHEHEGRSEHFASWQWDTAPLAPWGAIESARVELRLPTRMTDEALLAIEPSGWKRERNLIYWEYEGLQALESHGALLLAPPAYERMMAWLLASNHRDLATLFGELQSAAQREGVPFPDQYPAILGELLAALRETPEDRETRQDLVALYRQRAEALPEMRLNYILLTAQELTFLLAQQPGQSQIAGELAAAYYEAAQIASQEGDPSGALVYLKRASEVEGVEIPEIVRAQEELTMRWALELAQRGQVAEALVQMRGVLSPGLEDQILHYAPDLAYARTDVYLTAAARRAVYHLRPYPPSAERLHARLEELTRRISALPGWEARLGAAAGEPEALSLELVAGFGSLEELGARQEALAAALLDLDDLTTLLIAAPWRTEIAAFGLEQNPWYGRFEYRERIDLSELAEALAQKNEYAGWRLVELRAAAPEDAQKQIERELALVALRDQNETWQHLASGSHWVFYVEHEALPDRDDLRWLVPWGQGREMTARIPLYQWRTIGLSGLALLAFVLLLVALASASRRRR